MPKSEDKCVKEVKKSIKKGKTPKTYKTKSGKRKKTNPYAICRGKRK